MRKVILYLMYFLKVDLIIGRFSLLIDELKFIRDRERLKSDNLKYVRQGWHYPMVVSANGEGTFKIGVGSHLKSDSYVEYMGGVSIGSYFHTGRGLTIFSSNHDYDKGDKIPYGDKDLLKEVVIGDFVWCGANVTIVPGVHIGDGVVIGSGSVVTKDIPDGAVIGGNPAKILKYRDMDHFNKLKKEMKYN